MQLSQSLRILACTALMASAGVGGLKAADAEFTNSLPVWAKNAAGLSKLSPAQVTALNAAVEHDITLAEQGDTVAFATSFSARRTPEQRATLGLGLLSFDQINRLDEDVAHAIAYRPRLSTVTTGSAPMVNAGAIATFKRPWETHGELSMTVGGGKHSSFYGGSAEVEATDPSGTFTIGVGFSEFHGKGLLPCYGGLNGSGYGPYGYGGYAGYPYGW